MGTQDKLTQDKLVEFVHQCEEMTVVLVPRILVEFVNDELVLALFPEDDCARGSHGTGDRKLDVDECCRVFEQNFEFGCSGLLRGDFVLFHALSNRNSLVDYSSGRRFRFVLLLDRFVMSSWLPCDLGADLARDIDLRGLLSSHALLAR